MNWACKIRVRLPRASTRLVTGLLIVSLMLTGCASMTEREPDGPIVHHEDSAKPDADGGLLLEFIDFNWRYLARTDQIRIDGRARNLTGKAIQGCRILANAVDQFDFPLGFSESYLEPTYLAPGAIGRFDLYFERGRWVKNIQIRYQFESRY
ncbi:MAG: hypothetical protein KKB20_01735 [Proteobacteria bacterium]|nr:hypothetical protein [Pseudomonadota bacterium]